MADDNKTPTEPRRPLPGDTKAAVPLPRNEDGTPRFKPWEEWAWDQLATTGEVYMSEVPAGFRGGEDEDKDPVTSPFLDEKDEEGWPKPRPVEDWPAWQHLSAAFLQLILLNPIWRESRARNVCDIYHAVLVEALDLESETVPGDLGFYSCCVTKNMTLRSARIGDTLGLNGSYVDAALRADRLETGGGVFLRDGARFTGDVRLVGAKLGGDLDCNGSYFSSGLEASGLQTGGFVYLRGRARFTGPVGLLGAKVGGDLACNGSHFGSGLEASGLQTGGFVYLSGGARFTGGVGLLGATLGGDLSCTGSHFDAALLADGLETGGNVFLRGGSTFASSINLPGARIGRHLQLSGSRFEATVDLTGARIEGEVWLDETNIEMPVPEWGEGAFLNLQNARLGALHGSTAAWRCKGGNRFVARDLDGLRFDRAGGGDGGKCLEDASKDELVAWLEDDLLSAAEEEKHKTSPPEPGQRGHPTHFSPSPYRALATALDSAGQRAKARHVRWAMARREARSRRWRDPMKFLSVLSGSIIGFGFKLHFGIAWFLGSIFAFALGGHLAAGGWDFTPNLERLGNFFDWLRFSLSNAVPIVELDPVEDKTFLSRQFPAKNHTCTSDVARWIYLGQRALTLMLLFLLAAGFTGWAQRRGE